MLECLVGASVAEIILYAGYLTVLEPHTTNTPEIGKAVAGSPPLNVHIPVDSAMVPTASGRTVVVRDNYNIGELICVEIRTGDATGFATAIPLPMDRCGDSLPTAATPARG